MKFFSLLLIFCAAFVSGVHAEISAVSVELSVDQQQFLSNEDLPVSVRIVNRSGQTLQFGKQNDWLTFTVEARDNYVVSQLGDVPVVGEFSIDSSQAAIKRVNLTPYFDFRQSGRYQITANVKIPQWNQDITSRPVVFDIVTPTTLKEIDFGVPTTVTNKPPEMRKYILQQAMYLKQMRLYLRLTDSTGTTVFRVFPIAPMVSISKPEVQVDRLSNLHVLHQIGRQTFNYSVINPDGQVIRQQTYEYSTTRPVLRANAEGEIFVIGGVQRLTANDLPKSAEIPKTNAKVEKP